MRSSSVLLGAVLALHQLVQVVAWSVSPLDGPRQFHSSATRLSCVGDNEANQSPTTRRAMSKRAAQLAVAGAAAFSLARPVLAARKERTVNPVIATNREMQEVTATQWLEKHPVPGMRELVVGLDGEPFWLITQGDPGDDTASAIAQYALKAECTHLGCLAEWRAGQSKYICPCHGSEYDKMGKVLKGPAPTSLGLAKVDVLENDKVMFKSLQAPCTGPEPTPSKSFRARFQKETRT